VERRPPDPRQPAGNAKRRFPVTEAGDHRSLLEHMEWADALIWKSVLRAASLDEDQSIRERLYHVHATQRLYLQTLTEVPIQIPELRSFGSLRALGVWARQLHDELARYRETPDDIRLARDVPFPRAAAIETRFGRPAVATTGEYLLQLVLHTTYHRGQVATRIREAGGEPPLTDFIAWIWMGRPAPEWVE
jgi:uncharacterized damage-inducible protein DinB